jgi:hypothetical protein
MLGHPAGRHHLLCAILFDDAFAALLALTA